MGGMFPANVRWVEGWSQIIINVWRLKLVPMVLIMTLPTTGSMPYSCITECYGVRSTNIPHSPSPSHPPL